MKPLITALLLTSSSFLFAQSPPTKVEHEQKMNTVGEIAPTVGGLRQTQASSRNDAPTPSQQYDQAVSSNVAGEPVAPIYKISSLMNLNGVFVVSGGNEFGIDNELLRSTLVDESGQKVGHLRYYYDMNNRLERVTRHYDNLDTPIETYEYSYGLNYVSEYMVRSTGSRYLSQEIPIDEFKLYWSN